MKRFRFLLFILFPLFLFPTTSYAGYASEGWTHRGSITFPTAGRDLPVLLTSADFDSDITDYSYGNGSDLRFSTDATNGSTPVAFDIMHKADPFKYVTVNLPDGVTTIYYWVGNPNVDYLPSDDTYGSDNAWADADAVFTFDQGISSAIVSDGYAHPFASSIIEPSAVYNPHDGKAYVVYQKGATSKGYAYITTYTYSTGLWSTPVIVSASPALSEDSHGAPSIVIDDDYYIHVFYGCHSTPLGHAKSTSPEDISAWTAQDTIGTYLTYPHVLKLADGTIFIIIRYRPTFLLSEYHLYTSDDDYASATMLLDNNGEKTIYMSRIGYDEVNGKLWMVWCEENHDLSPVEYRNLYAAYYLLSDSHLYASDGTDLGTDISAAERSDCLILNTDTAGYQNNYPYLFLDSDQFPHIIFPLENAGGTYDHTYMYWDGSDWSDPETIVETGSEYNHAAAYFNEDVIEAYLTVSDDRAGDIEHWQYANGNWSKNRTVFDDSDIRRPEPVNDGADEEKIIENAPVEGPHIIFSNVATGDWTGNDCSIYAIDDNHNYVGTTKLNTIYGGTADVCPDLISNNYYGVGLNFTNTAIDLSYSSTGKIGGALELNGTSEMLSIRQYDSPYTARNILTTNTEFTIMGWVYINGDSANTVSANQVLVSIESQYYFMIRWTDSGDASYPNTFSTLSYDGTSSTNVRSNTYVAGTWHHVAVTYDTNDDMKMYIDGELEDTIANVGAPSSAYTSGKVSRFSRDGATTNRCWVNGDLDMWMFYSEGLDADDIALIYDNQDNFGSYVTSKTDLIPANTLVPSIQPIIMY